MQRKWLLLACFAVAVAQTPPPKEAPKDPGVFRLPSQFPPEEQPVKPKEPEAPKQVVLENSGKPIKIPFACSEEDITANGMTCTIEEPCAVYLELAAVYGLNSRIYLAGNLHNGASTMYSVLLVSDDNGKTFVEAFDRVRNGGFDHIQFFDDNTGWISGALLLALPRDPFLLLTTDGGKNWRKRMVSEDTKLGTIDQFSFQSKTAGVLLLDRGQGAEGGSRYEKYETMTGGDTWMVREVSPRPIAVKAATPPAADWRLQVDPKLKAHVVERRVGERWQRAAAFQVQVGECKPAANPLDAPPPSEQIPEVSTAPVEGGGREPVTVPRKGPAKPPSLKKPK